MVRWRSATAVGASELDERRWSERRSWRIGGRQRGGTSTATKSENVVFDIPVVEAARAALSRSSTCRITRSTSYFVGSIVG
jgi:hypothetical protein